MNRAELIIARLTEENDLQRASIQELSKQVAKMQKVVDAAWKVLSTFRVTQIMAERMGGKNQLFNELNSLKQALAELETKPEPFKPSSYKDSVY